MIDALEATASKTDASKTDTAKPDATKPDAAPRTPAKAPSLGRMAALDGLRLLAAVAVMLYHFTARENPAWGEGTVPPDIFPELSRYTMFGQFGVDLFFVISGFVILMSAWGRPVSAFVTSRVTRLFPAYWAGVLLTAFLLVVLWPERKEVQLSDIATNLTMVQSAFGVSSVDGVYWTLWFELRFYVMIGVLLLVGLTGARALAFAALWPTAAVMADTAGSGLLANLLLAEYAPLFACGMAMYMVARDRSSMLAWLVLAQNVVLSVTWCAGNTRDRLIGWTTLEPTVMQCVLMTLGCIGLVALVTLTPLRRLNSRILTTAGLLTYPLYLIHQYWGWWIISGLHNDLPPYAVLAIAGGVAITLAALVHVLVERPLAPILKRGIARSFASLAAQERQVSTRERV
ncbi:acetyltransferase [Nocardioidaceae bacterium Broad-1]|uniref:acyltransferase family protein n=1 Tax=Nocardioides luteus TaxID=1844 RepID=UPI000202947A|nr:acyltransferase [Nocardioides luteus]EGD45395.1 acetyltransferase [Nocardioidaceae bacterium Broad-1]MBG6094126.1 peptidoglycan/LPS O-acetylase OafA/YrhL [Nocardioides luteus]